MRVYDMKKLPVKQSYRTRTTRSTNKAKQAHATKERSAFVRDRARYKEKTCYCIRILDDRRASHSSSLCIPKAPVYRWPELTYKWRMPAETSCWSIFPIMGNLLCHFLYKRAAFLPRPPIKRPLTTQQPNNPIILLAVLLWGPPKTTWEDNSKGLCPKPP